MEKENLQGLATDQFFYFFLRLRKSEVRRTVLALQARYPQETPEQLARRLIASHARLTLLGGALFHLPLLMPGIGQAFKLAGFVGGASMLTRMHLYLILEIALLFGKDIDDRARVPELAAVLAATGLGAAAPLLLPSLKLNLHPLYSLPIAGLSTSAVTHLIGYTAIGFYRGKRRSAGGDAAVTSRRATASV
jgi:hypothetical protein